MKKLLILGASLCGAGWPLAFAVAAPSPISTPTPTSTPQTPVAKPAVTKVPVAKAPVAQPLAPKAPTKKPMVVPTSKAKLTASGTTKIVKSIAVVSKPLPLSAPQEVMEKLPNGVSFITRNDKWAPRVAISLVLRAGAADETPATAGWRRLVVNAMLRSAPQGYETDGATGIEATESLARAAEKAGGTLGASVGDDFIEIFALGDADKAPQLLDLALAFWRKPRLSDDDLKTAREKSQNQLDADDLDTASKTQAALRSQLFRDARGELSSYGLPDYGTPTSLANLSDDKLRELFATKLANARLTVSAAGDFDEAAIRQKLAELPASASREPTTPSFAPPKGGAPALVVRELPVPSAWVFVSYPLAGNTQNDAPALRVLAAALGDSSQARLPARLLKNVPMGANSPASSVAAQYIPRRYASEMVIFAQTGPQNVERVKNALLDEMRKLRDTPLSAVELQSAKTYARGNWSIERQDLRGRAFQAGLATSLGGPLDTTWPARIETVSAGDVQRVARKYLAAYAVALVMPAE